MGNPPAEDKGGALNSPPAAGSGADLLAGRGKQAFLEKVFPAELREIRERRGKDRLAADAEIKKLDEEIGRLGGQGAPSAETGAILSRLRERRGDAEAEKARHSEKAERIEGEIGRLKRAGGDPQAGPEEKEPSISAGLVGLALSGGGIRSATVSLGVLQALAREDVLGEVDYLSTVSGGGYLGACVTSLLSSDEGFGLRPADPDMNPAALKRFPLGFTGGENETPAVQRLRAYSNYLAPRHGPFRMETWRMAGWYAGSVFFNLLPVFFAFLFLLSLVAVGLGWLDDGGSLELALGAAAGLFLACVVFLLFSRRKQQRDGWSGWAARYVAVVAFLLFVFGAPKLYGKMVGWSIGAIPVDLAAFNSRIEWLGMCQESMGDKCGEIRGSVRKLREAMLLSGGWIGSGQSFLDHLMDKLEEAGVHRGDKTHPDPANLFERTIDWTIGKLRILGGPFRGTLVHRAISSAVPDEYKRAFRLPGHITKDWEFRGAKSQVFLGLSKAGISFQDGGGIGKWLQWLAPILIGLLPAVLTGYLRRSVPLVLAATAAFAAAVVLVHVLGRFYDDYPGLLGFLLLGSGAGALGFGFISINRTSLLTFYRDRLADCYVIGKTNGSPPEGLSVEDWWDISKRSEWGERLSAKGRRQEDLYVEATDGLRLSEILPRHNGPYHLINATLNLSGSDDLWLRGRMADHFLFSKCYCGSHRGGVGYAETPCYEDECGANFGLADAMAVAGAAFNTQMGEGTKAGRAVLLSLFNIRLGRWLPNPNPERSKPRGVPVWWHWYFVKEMLSWVDENDWFVHVSDGGHFENTGVYALLQRRCKTIICVDNGMDPGRQFEDLANLIRKARIDMGVQIKIDLRSVHGDPATGRAPRAYAKGEIVYPCNGGTGTFVFIKPTLSLSETESEDILEYARKHPDFPQQTTLDQFYDEPQFESYRELGYRIAKDAVRQAIRPLLRP